MCAAAVHSAPRERGRKNIKDPHLIPRAILYSSAACVCVCNAISLAHYTEIILYNDASNMLLAAVSQPTFLAILRVYTFYFQSTNDFTRGKMRLVKLTLLVQSSKKRRRASLSERGVADSTALMFNICCATMDSILIRNKTPCFHVSLSPKFLRAAPRIYI